ncbi:MAG: glyoxalase [Gammaproteobacteria bacterium]|nr:glyoxalase [Gammaproteobacteria bacterium]
MQPFHLAFPVTDLEATRHLFCDILGCTTGREDSRWIDFNFYGHQITAHLVEADPDGPPTNPVDGEEVPASHFGIILSWDEWHRLRDRLVEARIRFLIEPQIRFAGQVGEQATLFFKDPSGNALEFKSFKDPQMIFATA